MLLMGFLCVATSGFGAENLLLNGDLSAGAGETPPHWTRTPFAPANSFAWSHPKGEPPSFEVAIVRGYFRHSPYWRQQLTLPEPGWYLLRTEVKTDTREAFAVLKFEGRLATVETAQSADRWTPLEVYLNATSGPLQIGCGVRAMPSGRAFFRDLSFSRISGTPPPGSRQLDITHAIVVSPAEKKALREVELVQSRPDESLWASLLNLRVIALILFLLASLTWLDARYNPGQAGRRAPRDFLYDPTLRSSAIVATLLCLTLLGTWLVTRIEYLPGHGLYVEAPHAVGGDEPHYLVMINSLLFQHDLHLQTVYDDVEQGGPEAGVLAHLNELDRHTIVVNRLTGNRAMAEVRNGEWFRNPAAEFAPSTDVYEVPVHPTGFPILMALAIAPLRPTAGEVEADVGWVLMLIAWLGIVATYFVGRQVEMNRELGNPGCVDPLRGQSLAAVLESIFRRNHDWDGAPPGSVGDAVGFSNPGRCGCSCWRGDETSICGRWRGFSDRGPPRTPLETYRQYLSDSWTVRGWFPLSRLLDESEIPAIQSTVRNPARSGRRSVALRAVGDFRFRCLRTRAPTRCARFSPLTHDGNSAVPVFDRRQLGRPWIRILLWTSILGGIHAVVSPCHCRGDAARRT